MGLIVGDDAADIILVGKYNPAREPITLDDLIVALRARFLYKAWPVVSIDPNPTSFKKPQSIRFEGGIENTQFGADLLEADYRLKELSFGLLPAKIPTLLDKKPVVDGNRFWFYPLSAHAVVREGVAVIRKVRIGVLTEAVATSANGLVSRSDRRDSTAEKFASAITENFPQLAIHHLYFSRLQALTELVALSRAMESLPEPPNISFWLSDYKVRYVSTPTTLTALWRVTPPYGAIGGAKLEALALQLRSGDATALRKAVLITRPEPTAVTWSFLVGDWITPLFKSSLSAEDVCLFLKQANELAEAGNYAESLPFYSAAIDLDPSFVEARFARALVYALIGHSELALQDLTRPSLRATLSSMPI